MPRTRATYPTGQEWLGCTVTKKGLMQQLFPAATPEPYSYATPMTFKEAILRDGTGQTEDRTPK